MRSGADQSPEVNRALVRALDEGYDNLDSDSRSLVDALYRAIAHNWSNAYYQYRIGTLDDEQWQGLLRGIEAEARRSLIRAFWDSWDYVYDDPFRSFMDSIRVGHVP